MAKKTSQTTEIKERQKKLDKLYAELDEYQKIDAEYKRLSKLRTQSGDALKAKLDDGTFVLNDLSIAKKTITVRSTDKKLVEKMVKEIGRQDILDAAMGESQRVTLSVTRSTIMA